jgi:hypothetical protein
VDLKEENNIVWMCVGVCCLIHDRVQCFGTSEESNGPVSSIKSRKLFDQLSVSQRQKKDLVPSGL